jgi:biopolymer transport protein ExbB
MVGRWLSFVIRCALLTAIGLGAAGRTDVHAQAIDRASTAAATRVPPAAQDTAGVAKSTAADASTVDAAQSGLNLIWRGGPMFLAIGLCSFVLFIFVFERAISLRRGRVIPGPFVKRFIHQLQENELPQDDALDRCRENQSPVAEVFAAAVKKWGRPAVEVEQAVLDTGERVANRLRKYLRVFHGISSISPLLGLLGTVLGMISSFSSIANSDAMGRPELLAAGISQALLTTAGGLTVAIPAIAAHLYFMGRVDRLVMDIDALAQDVVNAIACDGWRETSPQRAKKPEKTVRAKAA